MRIWWFAAGVFVGAWGTLRTVQRVQRARAALSPGNLARNGALGVADLLETGATRLTHGSK
jgi:hypothetical protein